MTINRTTFIHFNDVYNVEYAPKFVASIKNTRKRLLESSSQGEGHGKRHVFTIFSGDAFSPSIMSTVLRGEQMIPVLNALDIDIACLGNHDLDFGIQEFVDLRQRCNFPWLCSNAWDIHENEPLGGCREFYIIDKSEVGGPRILTIGLIEKSWLDTLSSVEPEDLMFEDPCDFVNRRVPELKAEYGHFDAVVAITHMRMPSDYALARNGGVDIILGGHDHHYEDTVINNIRILNSGTDFNTYSVIDVNGRSESDGLETDCHRVDVKACHEEPDPAIADEIANFQSLVNQSMDRIVGQSKVRLDARFSEIRTKETNISNFLAELMTRATGADIAILNAGTIRADRFIEAGVLTMKDLCDLLPMADETMVVSITGEKVLLALENGVSQYPAMEGRFPCVDGIRFSFDPSKPAGSRVVPGSVFVREHPLYTTRGCMIRGESTRGHDSSEANLDDDDDIDGFGKNDPQGYVPLDLAEVYSVVSKSYLISGKDGFDAAFKGATVLRDEENSPILPTILRNLFTQIHTLKCWTGATTRGTVIEAASKFKGIVRTSILDPFAIKPRVDGRIRNIRETSV